MISAPNRPLRLNGNRACLTFALLLLLSSCNLFKPASSGLPDTGPEDELAEIEGTKVYDPETGDWVVIEKPPAGGMDTIKWENNNSKPIGLPEDQRPPSGAGNDQNSQMLGRYNVSVLLPFMANEANADGEIKNKVSLWSVHYYGGLLMALDKLRAEGISLNISVKDSQANPSVVTNMIARDKDLEAAHMIMGPYRRENVKLLADFVKNQNRVLVSPYSAAPNLTSENTNFIQVNPSLETHVEALYKHAREYFSPRDIVLISRNNQVERVCLQYIQQAHQTVEGSSAVTPLAEYVIPEDPSQYDRLDIQQFLEGKSEVAFIVPSWADETFVYSVLRNIDLARKRGQNAVVYGMPPWMSYERIDYDYFEKLNVRISSHYYLDYRDDETASFRRDFYDRFGTLPNTEAFIGYDLMLYFGRMLHQHGTRFQVAIDREETAPGQYLHTQFEFEPVVDLQPGADPERLPIEQYENKFVNILVFRDYHFQPLK